MLDINEEIESIIKDNPYFSDNIQEKSKLGDKIIDGMANFSGSWKFLFLFFSFIGIWIGINVFILITKPFDPYPFILLNLILSCLAAIQAPIIMMSQNRTSHIDRLRDEHVYEIILSNNIRLKYLIEAINKNA
jgi:uncharacterized membrane protein